MKRVKWKKIISRGRHPLLVTDTAALVTGNATDLLKDGDLVEVDANKGLVKILSK